MSRDYSQFMPSLRNASKDNPAQSRLQSLGWQPFFAQQLSIEELEQTPPMRVTQIHRSGLHVTGETVMTTLPPNADVTVGDWLLYDADTEQMTRRLERKSLIKRRAPGHDRAVQLIAANIDTAFIVSSCNDDFNIARLERYIALAFEAQVTPVIVLTKADQSDAAADYAEQARSIAASVPVVTLDARGDAPSALLAPWCGIGQSVAFLGSSGVGKSTMVNALAGSAQMSTQAIREDDARGRHTTTYRHLHILPSGCAVLDTPGMRELQLTDAAGGVGEVFADLEQIAGNCKFNDCAHETEPGCAVRAAIGDGQIDASRLARWKKLVAEEKFNSASIAQRRSNDRAFGKMVKQAMKKKNR